jgi:[ribosomal protein S5]-alanine N-acetyltransferase
MEIGFKLRPWNISDLDSLVKYANNWNVAKHLTDKFPHPYAAADGAAFIAFATADDPKRIFTIDVNGEAVGGIGLHPQSDISRKNAELGYWLGEPFWGQKIISRAIGEMLDFGFAHYDIDRIFARPFGTNTASQKVLEKNNFKLEGRFEKILFKDGVYLDELIYAVRRKDWESK